MGKALTIAIVGAGIGGLVTALVLHRQGHRVRLYEAARELRRSALEALERDLRRGGRRPSAIGSNGEEALRALVSLWDPPRAAALTERAAQPRRHCPGQSAKRPRCWPRAGGASKGPRSICYLRP